MKNFFIKLVLFPIVFFLSTLFKIFEILEDIPDFCYDYWKKDWLRDKTKP